MGHYDADSSQIECAQHTKLNRIFTESYNLKYVY